MPLSRGGPSAEKGGKKIEGLQRSQGGLTGKIRTLAEAQGRPLRFILTAPGTGLTPQQLPRCSR